MCGLKKLLKVIMGMVVLCGALYSVALAANMYEDFESYEIGSKGGGFASFAGIIDGDENNKYAVLLEKNAAAVRRVDAVSGTVSFSLRFMQPGPEATYARLFMLWDSGKSNRSANVVLSRTQLLFFSNNGASEKVLASNLETDKWYEISVTLDFDSQQIKQMYLNGAALLHSPEPMFQNNRVENLGNIEIKKEIDEGKLYIDDLSVVQQRYPRLTEKLGQAKGMLTNTEGNAPGEYPRSSFTMLKDVIMEAEKEMNGEEVLSQSRQAQLEAKLENASNRFKQSRIFEEVSTIYSNNFDDLDEGSKPSGFLVANNAYAVSENGGKAIKLENTSRLLYQHSAELEGKYYVSLSFMQKTKGVVNQILDVSDATGNFHAVRIYSNGTGVYAKASGSLDSDLSGKNDICVINEYEENVWYNLRVLLSTDDQKFTVYIKKPTETAYTETEENTFWQTLSSFKRVSDTRILNNGSAVYIDDICVEPYMEQLENAANSIEFGEYPRYIFSGESVLVSAQVYDRRHDLWGNQAVSYTVVSGDAQIDSEGRLTVNDGYSGMVKIKAEADGGLYDYAEIVLLPTAEITEVSVVIENGVMQIIGRYNMLLYTEVDLTASVSGQECNQSEACKGNADGTFTAVFFLADTMKTQDLTISIRDAEFGAIFSITKTYYGSDAADVFLAKFNESTAPQEVIDTFRSGIGLAINFAYDKNKAEYSAYIKKKGTIESFAAMCDYIEEANLVFGIQYAARENIADVVEAGTALLVKNGCNMDAYALSDGKKERIYLSIMGYSAESLETLCSRMNELVKEVSGGVSSGSHASLPSYKGSGGGGGGGYVAKKNTVDLAETEENPTENSGSLAAVAFEDIGEAAWAEREITKLAALNVLSGYDGRVRPNDAVTRAEFAKMVAKLFEMESGRGTNFEDVSEKDWFFPYVAAMADAELITGYPDGKFYPDDSISRQDSAVILKRCIEAFSIPVYTKQEARMFQDGHRIAEYAVEAVSSLCEYGVISGKGNDSFAPEENITRAEAAVMLVRVYSFLETIDRGAKS